MAAYFMSQLMYGMCRVVLHSIRAARNSRSGDFQAGPVFNRKGAHGRDGFCFLDGYWLGRYGVFSGHLLLLRTKLRRQKKPTVTAITSPCDKALEPSFPGTNCIFTALHFKASICMATGI
jgi:hypothetical protein